MFRTRRIRVAIAALSSTIVPLSLMAASSAAAPASSASLPSGTVSLTGDVSASGASSAVATSAPFTGKVIARSGLNVRMAPTSESAVVGGLRRGQTVGIDCKVPGPYVDANARWYNLSRGGWVAARYVDNVGAAPAWCGGSYQGKVIARGGLNVRTGPDMSNTRITTVGSGSRVTVGCKVKADVVGGNPRWYWVHLSGRDGWVAARYVVNIGAIPTYC